MSKKVKQVIGGALGCIAAFVAEDDKSAMTFSALLSAELESKSLGKALSLKKTYDGFWISVNGSNEHINKLIFKLIFKLGKAQKGIQIAFVAPSTELLVGGEVLRIEGENPRSLIRMVLGIPDHNEERKQAA